MHYVHLNAATEFEEVGFSARVQLLKEDQKVLCVTGGALLQQALE